MAGRIKGITIEIGGKTDGLEQSLSGVNKHIKSTQKELKDVERLLKLDPTNTDLLRQKQELLAKAISGTEDKLEQLKEAERQAQEQFKRGEITKEQYDALQREIIATEQELEKLENRASESSVALAKIGHVAGEVSDGAGKVADKTRGISTAATGAIAAIGAMAVKAAVLSDDLNTLAKQTGFSTEEIQKMQYAADRIDVELETITKSAAKMTKNLTSTSSEVTGAWDRLGISIRDSNGELRNSTDIFYETIAALSEVSNETERDTLAMTLFGKSANELAGIIDDGGAALRALGSEAKDLGLILDQETLDSLNETNDILDKIKAQATATIAKSGAKALQALTPIIEDAADALSEMLDYIADLDERQIKFALSALGVVAIISPLAGIIGGIGTAIKGVTTALTFLNAHPIIAAATAVTALGVAIAAAAKESEVTAEAAQNMFDTIQSSAAELTQSVADINATESAAANLIDRLEELNEDGLDESEVSTYNATLDTLLATMPELASLIDAQTGEIIGGTDALRQNTKAWAQNAKQQAYNEHLVALYKDQAAVQLELAENMQMLEEANAELEAAEQNLIETQERLGDVAHDEAEQNAQRNIELSTAQARYDAAAVAVERYSTALEEDRAALEEANTAIAENEAVIGTLIDAETELAATEATVTTATAEQAAAVNEIGAAWAAAYNEAKTSIDSQIGLFDVFTAELDEAYNSLTELTGAMDTQAANITSYADNLAKAAQYGIDEGLVASLADGSAESAAYIAAIVEDIEEAGVTTEGLGEDATAAVAEFNSAYQKTQQAREYLAGTIAGIETQLSVALQDGSEFGVDLVRGMVSGIQTQSSTLYNTISRVVNNAINTARIAADTHSPSKKTKKIFEDVGEGMVVGLGNKEDDVIREVHKVVDHALAIDPHRAAIDVGSAMAGITSGMLSAGVTNNNSRTVQVTVQNTFGEYDSAAGNAAANDLVRQINRALGRAL